MAWGRQAGPAFRTDLPSRPERGVGGYVALRRVWSSSWDGWSCRGRMRARDAASVKPSQLEIAETQSEEASTDSGW